MHSGHISIAAQAIMDSDEDWLDDAPTAHAGAHGDPLVDRQWERITTRYADVCYLPPSQAPD